MRSNPHIGPSIPMSMNTAALGVLCTMPYKKSPKPTKPVQHAAPAMPETAVKSWRMNKLKCYNALSPFPTPYSHLGPFFC
jgi:hypothetical protein